MEALLNIQEDDPDLEDFRIIDEDKDDALEEDEIVIACSERMVPNYSVTTTNCAIDSCDEDEDDQGLDAAVNEVAGNATLVDDSDVEIIEDEEAEGEDEQVCPVCLDILPKPDQIVFKETRSKQYLAKTKPCNHFYHDFCISEWSKKANTCPQCRSSFNEIELLSGNNVVETIHVEDTKFPMEFDESDFIIPNELIEENNIAAATANIELPEFRHQHLVNPVCCLCDSASHSRSAFAICTDCSCGYHISCLGMMDVAQFHCPMCDSLQGPDSIIDNRRTRRRAGGRRATSTAGQSSGSSKISWW
ncbi:unnamed protein product [Ambrosiozyma monospora]|uniref:Unnamed protein product n=1 Tax=Ambrosiozyma monospora TaxID=43982 RepID=A0ACB5ST37_AMBMO|nr:unnamed protein product [Ambrosiozyma monospora]